MAYLKNEFELWITNLRRSDGAPYSKETINNYISVIKNYCKKLDNLSIENTDLFYLDNVIDFDKTHREILDHPRFESVNRAYHRSFSSGLIIYRRFLQAREGANMEKYVSFEEWLCNYQNHRYRESTVRRYVVALEKAEERLLITLDKPILEIKTLEEFEHALKAIQSAQNYDFVNKKYGNGDLSAALSAFAKYLKNMMSDSTHKVGKFDSWEIIEETTAVKTCDKSFFDYNGSGVPKEICWFFEAENLSAGETKTIKLLHNGKEYAGKVANDTTDRRRVRIFWGTDLGKVFGTYKNIEGKATFVKEQTGVYKITIIGGEKEMTTKERIAAIRKYIEAKGFNYGGSLIENFYLGLKSKPFVILAGTSGTGKTRLVRLFAEAIKAEYKLVSVRPDWSDSSDLFGHVDLNQKFVPGAVIDFVKQAELNPTKPYFLCLDEMNLARVEYYMSDILSAIETRRYENGMIITDPVVSSANYGNDTFSAGKYGKVILPGNLYIVGTVNMDETTFPFSKKVLDRANTIEFSYVDLLSMPEESFAKVDPIVSNNDFLVSDYITMKDAYIEPDKKYIDTVCTKLSIINDILETANAHIGYRVRDEIVFYMLYNSKTHLLDFKDAFDNQIMQKILPRVQGSSESIKKMLEELKKLCETEKYESSLNKINFMIKRYEEDGFTSFWL